VGNSYNLKSYILQKIYTNFIKTGNIYEVSVTTAKRDRGFEWRRLPPDMEGCWNYTE